MGQVWLAHDQALNRSVALKEIVPPIGLTAQERAELHRRTVREARAAARLNSPYAVRIYDTLVDQDRPWIVMEYVAARSLHQVLNEDGPLTPIRAAEVGLAVLAALRAAHAAGVLHRDVKPANVLLAEDGRVVLTDFGLATFDNGDASVTRSGLILGSPQFIAPERAREGRSLPQSDLFSLGATLHAAVEGKSPFARPTAVATLTALATESPDPAPNAGPRRPAINALLCKDPAARADAVKAERLLRRALGGAPPARMRPWLGPPPSRFESRTGVRWSRRPGARTPRVGAERMHWRPPNRAGLAATDEFQIPRDLLPKPGKPAELSKPVVDPVPTGRRRHRGRRLIGAAVGVLVLVLLSAVVRELDLAGSGSVGTTVSTEIGPAATVSSAPPESSTARATSR